MKKKEKFRNDILTSLQRQLKLDNLFSLPRPKKVVVNIGAGRLRDPKDHEEVIKVLTLITGQKPVARGAKKAIASFKTRQGQIVGFKVTLHGQRMWDFLERLSAIVLPRVRDFRGLSSSAVDAGGNLTIGFREHIVFPEVSNEDVRHIFGLEVTIVLEAKDREEAMAWYRAVGFPLVGEPLKIKRN